MMILHSFDELHQIKETIVYALGTFDGIHKGHQRVIKQAIALARPIGAKSIVVTFERHPYTILKPEALPKMILAKDCVLEVLEKLGVDAVLQLPMNAHLLSMTADAFLDTLTTVNRVASIVVGDNFTCGAQGLGTPQYMQTRLAKQGIQVEVEPLLSIDGQTVSSTYIRQEIELGHMKRVHNLLGRPFYFTGQVIKGDQRGRTLGFPTLNFLFPNELATPPDGVYINRVLIRGKWYGGVGNIGDNPTFTNQYHRCEVHVFDFEQDIYGDQVTVEFIQYIRGEIKFANLDALMQQMKEDEKKARSVLATYQN